jgi:Protein of unknown function, DUF417
MVIMYFFFGYQKWFPYEFERLVPFISNGPLIWWLYPVFGHAGASYFLGVSEWTFGSLLLAGFWDEGVLRKIPRQSNRLCRRSVMHLASQGANRKLTRIRRPTAFDTAQQRAEVADLVIRPSSRA